MREELENSWDHMELQRGAPAPDPGWDGMGFVERVPGYGASAMLSVASAITRTWPSDPGEGQCHGPTSSETFTTSLPTLGCIKASGSLSAIGDHRDASSHDLQWDIPGWGSHCKDTRTGTQHAAPGRQYWGRGVSRSSGVGTG